jgi:hypothetical protein
MIRGILHACQRLIALPLGLIEASLERALGNPPVRERPSRQKAAEQLEFERKVQAGRDVGNIPPST